MATSSKTRLVLERKFDAKVVRPLSSTKLRVAAREVASAEIEMIRARTSRGLDRDGKPFREYAATYRRWKREFIKRGWGYRKRKPGGGFRIVKAKTTAFAADRVDQFLRLTGRLFGDMYVAKYGAKKVGDRYVVTYELDFRTARSKKLADIHNRQGAGRSKRVRKFWGGVKSAEDKAKLQTIFRKALR